MNQPDALMICLRQVTAQRKKIGFEKLSARVTNKEESDDSYCFVNLTLEMFDYNNGKMMESSTLEKVKDELWLTFVEDTQDSKWIKIPL